MSFKEMLRSQLSWEHIKEATKLFCLNLRVQITDFIEYLRVVYHYYWSMSYIKVDFSLVSSYLWHNPFDISKQFLTKRGDENVYAYGETPLTSLEKIVNECRINRSDVVFELGCGRGRTCFWLRHFVGCRVVGIEQIPIFVERANDIKNKFSLSDIEFRQEDMLQTDLKGATVIYLYGTCLDAFFLKKLAAKLEKLPSGTKIVTVSFPIEDYADKPIFEVMKRFPVKFTWGVADVYLQIRK